jgi:UDP-2,4-diacetamido-2,4,6-trideoxy-beta-L-altropyranose hydrolase
VVDHYALGAAWETSVRAVARRILAIDDLSNRRHECDLLLDQNHLPDGDARYRGHVPDDCQLLVGPRYALLRPEYREYRAGMRERSGLARRVLVFFGGTDPQNLTELAMRALSLPELRHLELDVVCGGDPSRRESVERQAAERPGTTIHGPRAHLADLMAGADLALGAGGSTTWERMCLGLPSLVITLADNQVAVADWLAREGLIRLVGHASTVTLADVRDAVVAALPRDQHRASIEKGMALSDGQGVPRVVNALEASRAS